MRKEWYDRWYAPNNAVLVVVGDVNPKEVFALGAKVLWSDQVAARYCLWISASRKPSRRKLGSSGLW